MKKVILIIILCYFGFSVFSQEKPGYIKYEVVLKNIPEHASEMKNIKLLKVKYEDTLKTIIKGYEPIISCATHNDLTKNEIKKKQNKLLELEKKIETFREQALNTLKKEELRIKDNIKTIIKYELMKYSSKKNIKSIVYEQDILYCPTCTDYTNDFLEYLKSR